MALTYILALIGVAIAALVIGLLSSLIAKGFSAFWAKVSVLVSIVVVAAVALLAFTALSAKCIEKCEVYETTVGPLFATPTTVPTQTPYVVYVYVVATPTSTSFDRCTVVSGNGIGCSSLP
jgi:predicted membrane-bound spermidine synthase